MSSTSTIGRTWELWAYRYKDGELWHVGEWSWVRLQAHQNPALQLLPVVPVLVEESLGNLYAPKVTHYGWRYNPCMNGNDGLPQQVETTAPEMIQIRAGIDLSNPERSLMLLDLTFPGGLENAIAQGRGHIVPLHITERYEV